VGTFPLTYPPSRQRFRNEQRPRKLVEHSNDGQRYPPHIGGDTGTVVTTYTFNMPAVFTPTPAEASLVNQIFLHADPQKSGIVTGDAAVKVFDGAKLPSTVLGEIWTLADDDNNGWLSRKGVAAAVRLMGWAQKGEPISAALLQKCTHPVICTVYFY